MRSRAEAIPRASITEAGITAVAWWGLLAGIVAVLLAPLGVVSIPPVLDYPNHLARAYVLSLDGSDPFLTRMYAPAWHLIPNLAVDALLPPLLHVLPLRLAGRVMLGIVLILPVAGVLALHRALHRRRSFWPLASCLVAYNAVFMLGFLNFSIGLGAALLVAALWIALRRTRPVFATVALAAGATLVFFCHVVALGGLGIIVAGMAVQDLVERQQRGRPTLPSALRLGLEVAAGFAAPAGLYLSSAFGATAGPVTYSSLKVKLTELLSPVLVYHPLLDGAAALCIVALVALSLLWRRRAGQTVLPLGIGLALAVLLVAFVAMPFAAKGGEFLDTRVPIMAACLLFAGLAPPPLPRGLAALLATAIATLFLARTAAVAQVWSAYGYDVAALEQVLSPVLPGDRVLIAQVKALPRRAWWHQVPLGRRLIGYGSADEHIAVLLLTERGAFGQGMFANPAQQPLRVLPPYDALINVRQPDLPDYTLLGAERLTPEQHVRFPALGDWQHSFDHLLVMEPTGAPDLQAVLPRTLQPEGRADIAALFRVRQAATAFAPAR